MILFFFNDTATTEIYTLSLHDALPIFELRPESLESEGLVTALEKQAASLRARHGIQVETNLDEEPEISLEAKKTRSEEHTSELQSRQYLVCRLLLEKKKKILRLQLNRP